jgi:hypothetical protein
MSVKEVLRSGRYVALAWAIAFCVPDRLGQAVVSPIDAHGYDCGTFALHTLLAIEGSPTPIDTLKSHLPGGRPNGYSMAELRDAAGTLGLALIGVIIPRSDRAPDRPALVFLKWKDHGHFVVARPVGHSGKLIQIIDLSDDPIVVEAAEFYASPGWTGLALVPRRRSWAWSIVASLLVSGFSILALHTLGRLRRPKNRRAISSSV